jgi:myo-inositol-1(or 4)-monophosphatase
MLNIAVEAAKEAGTFLKYSIGRVRTVETKKGQERNLVSEIDKMSEEKIISIIKRHYPHHAILAEESGSSAASSDYKWIIDPLDGTTNFLHGLPIFCVTIAIERKGELVAGVVFDPNLDELFTAERGTGAYLNGRRIHVSQTSTLIQSLLVTGFPYDIAKNPDHAIDRFVNFLMTSRSVRRLGSAALDLSYVAAGRFDGFWEVNLHSWDTAAGILLVKEAGGLVTDFAAGPPSIYKPQILASNGRIHNEMMEVLNSSAAN